MTRSKPIAFLASASVIPLAALGIAACGGGGAATAAPAPAPSQSTTAATATQTATVRVANSKLGRILVDATGRTLYLFKADSGTSSSCAGPCATAWPPLLVTGKPTAGTGLTASKLGTITRSGGSRQVTYNGHPLYLFIMDHKSGDVSGEGVTAFGAAWFAVSPAGNQVSGKPSGHGGGSASSRAAAPAAPPAAKPQPAPKAAPQPTPPPAAKPAPPAAKPAPPAAKPAPPASNGIPQNNGGDGDGDNNGGPSDGDGDI
jgi:predicted lipoprotein with Yx(FWY)xxD motif